MTMRRLAAVMVLLGACQEGKQAAPAASERPVFNAGNSEALAAARGSTTSFAASNDNGLIKANYDGAKLAPDPRATALCEVLHQVPAERKAACLGAKGTGITLTSMCVQTLTAALQGGKITIDDGAVARCGEAMKAATTDCAFAKQLTPPIPSPCDAIIGGTLPRGASCRSSLECEAGLQCFGVGPSDLGRCTPPAPVGALCGSGVDSLVSYTRQYSTDKTRPACDGYCRLNRCQQFRAVGEECQSDVMCGSGGVCREAKCVAR
jgi:hypothetical protein